MRVQFECTNDEWSNVERMPNLKNPYGCSATQAAMIESFVIWISFDIRHSGFVHFYNAGRCFQCSVSRS